MGTTAAGASFGKWKRRTTTPFSRGSGRKLAVRARAGVACSPRRPKAWAWLESPKENRVVSRQERARRGYHAAAIVDDAPGLVPQQVGVQIRDAESARALEDQAPPYILLTKRKVTRTRVEDAVHTPAARGCSPGGARPRRLRKSRTRAPNRRCRRPSRRRDRSPLRDGSR